MFSEAVSASYQTLHDDAIEAAGGAVRRAKRLNDSSAEWKMTVEPSSREAVTVSLSGGSDSCGQGDSVCTEDGRRLSNSASVTVEGLPLVPLTAELDGVPEAHDGESTFTFGPRSTKDSPSDSAGSFGWQSKRLSRKPFFGSSLGGGEPPYGRGYAVATSRHPSPNRSRPRPRGNEP